ncbi:MAG: response regulator [Desulfovibrio sp.]|nr:response regulator [Desulfovibrio sp.]
MTHLHCALTRLPGDEDTEGHRVEEALPPLEGMRVLLAADQPINAESAATILEETEASVSHAEDDLVARKLFVDPKPGFFDVVLMDLRMPHMNGFGVTAPIREMNRADAKTVPIIALTADAFAEDAQR